MSHRPLEFPAGLALRILQAAALLVALCAAAREAPPGMTEFNRACPAKELLPRLAVAHQSCAAGMPAACSEFVAIFRQLLPESDCQRPIDATGKVNYIVPAIWLAGEVKLARYMELLSTLRTPEARRLFASPEFRAVLDGEFAEEYVEKSEAAAKELGR